MSSHFAAALTAISSIVRSAMPAYASYSSQRTFFPCEFSRVVPTNSATPPALAWLTVAYSRRMSIGFRVILIIFVSSSPADRRYQRHLIAVAHLLGRVGVRA